MRVGDDLDCEALRAD